MVEAMKQDRKEENRKELQRKRKPFHQKENRDVVGEAASKKFEKKISAPKTDAHSSLVLIPDI